jgi:hypothetical protein
MGLTEKRIQHIISLLQEAKELPDGQLLNKFSVILRKTEILKDSLH